MDNRRSERIRVGNPRTDFQYNLRYIGKRPHCFVAYKLHSIRTDLESKEWLFQVVSSVGGYIVRMDLLRIQWGRHTSQCD